MYGNVPPTPEIEKINERFIENVIKQFGSREVAAKKHIDFAWQYFHEGDLETAMKRFNQSWLLNPNDPEVFFGFGCILDAERQPEKAIEMHGKAIEINPEYAGAYHNRALDYVSIGDFENAIPDFSKVMEIEPNNGQIYNDRAVAYYRLKQYNKSWEDVQKAKELGYEVHPGFLKAIGKIIKE